MSPRRWRKWRTYAGGYYGQAEIPSGGEPSPEEREDGAAVSILLDSPVPFEQADRDKTVVTAAGVRIPVMSIDHLITMKRVVGRRQDLDDIETLERIKHLQQGGSKHGG